MAHPEVGDMVILHLPPIMEVTTPQLPRTKAPMDTLPTRDLQYKRSNHANKVLKARPFFGGLFFAWFFDMGQYCIPLF